MIFLHKTFWENLCPSNLRLPCLTHEFLTARTICNMSTGTPVNHYAWSDWGRWYTHLRRKSDMHKYTPRRCNIRQVAFCIFYGNISGGIINLINQDNTRRDYVGFSLNITLAFKKEHNLTCYFLWEEKSPQNVLLADWIFDHFSSQITTNLQKMHNS